MLRRTIHRFGARLIGSAMLAGLLAIVPASASDLLNRPLQPLSATTASAQGGMDVGLVSPSFTQLPLSVQPGETFEIGVATAPGARCSGKITFRDHPPIDLEEMPAPAATCSWSVTVPPTVRSSTATVVVPLTRSGQWWTLYGVVYVRPAGDRGW